MKKKSWIVYIIAGLSMFTLAFVIVPILPLPSMLRTLITLTIIIVPIVILIKKSLNKNAAKHAISRYQEAQSITSTIHNNLLLGKTCDNCRINNNSCGSLKDNGTCQLWQG